MAGARAPASRSDRNFGRDVGDFLRRIWDKAGADNIFFMAGAIAFNVLVAIVPLVLAVLAVAGIVFKTRESDPVGELLFLIVSALPGALTSQVIDGLRAVITEVLDQSTGLLSVSTIFFIWIATRLVGTLRTALREIFDLQEDRGILLGKLFDIQMVIAAGTLLAINVTLTVIVRLLAGYGISFLGLEPDRFQTFTRMYLAAAAILSIWFMFTLIYRYLPARRIPWRIALIAATFTSAFFELTKAGFGWYVANIANYRTAYGNFATAIILFLWIYYLAVVFILGGEIGQVAALQRVRRRQKERLR